MEKTSVTRLVDDRVFPSKEVVFVGCPECGKEVERVGSIGVGAVGPNCKLPEGKPTYWCPNESCKLYRKLGEVAGGKFVVIE